MQHGSSPCYQRLALRSAPPRPSLPPRARGAPIGDGFSERRLSAELPLALGAGLGLQVARKGRDGRGDGALPAKEAKEGASGVRLPEILRFVWPVMLTLLASTLQGLIDSVFVGRCGGSVQLAALAPATSFLDGLSYVLSFTAIGTLNVLAAAGGTPQDDEHERLLLRSLAVATTVGCVLAVPVFFFAPHLVAFCGARGPVVSLSAQYVKIRAFGLPLDSLFRVANAGLLSIRDSRTGLQVVAFQSLLNGVGDALICPSMGIAGAAVTTVVAQAVTTAAMVVSLRRKGLVRHFRLPALRDSLDFLAFALPVCLTLALKVASVQFLGIAAAARGVVAAAAHQITKSLLWVFGLLASESLSSTAQAFLPASMQSGDVRTASQTLRLLLKLGASGALATAGLLCLVAAKGGLRIFCEDPAVLSAVPLVSLSCCILLTPFAFCMEGAHIAAQRQQWLSRRLCLLTSLVGLTFRFALPADAGLSQVWAVFAAYLLGRAIWYTWGLWGPQGVLKKAKVTVESYLEDQGT